MENGEKSDLIRMAEQNVLNRVREAQNWIKIMRAVNYAGMSLLFVGVGGEETEKFAREKFRERFGLDEDGNEHYEIMSLLDQYLNVPGSYLVDDEIEFREQAKEAFESSTK